MPTPKRLPAYIPPQPNMFFGGPEEWRVLSNNYCLWALCESATCRKAQTCRGDSRLCVPRGLALLSQEAMSCAFGMALGLDCGLSLNDARAELSPRQEKGWHAWRKAIRHARRETRAASRAR